MHNLLHEMNLICIKSLPVGAGLNVVTCGVANATGFGPLATNFSRAVASLATAISTYYFIYLFIFSFLRIHDEMNKC